MDLQSIKLLFGYVLAKHRSDEGATIVEYSLLVALIAVALIAGLQLLRGDIETLLGQITAAL